MKQPLTLTAALNQHINSSSAIHFIKAEHESRSITYAELRTRALGLLHHLQNSGASKGDELVLITQRNEAFIEGFWAAVLGGIIAVPVSFGISDEHKWKLFRILRQLKRPWIMVDQPNVLRLEKFAEKNGLDQEWAVLKTRLLVIEEIPTFTALGKMEEADENQTAFIQFSSGTTSDPKGVVLTHKNLISNIIGIGEGMRMSSNDTTFSWMPLSHDMGLIGFHLTPLFFGINQYLMPTDLFIRRPLLWLHKISRQQITVTCSPNFGYQHCLNAWSAAKEGQINLSNIRLIFNGAEPISVPLVQQFLKTFHAYGLKPETMFTVYGLAEASLAVAFPEAGKPLKYVTLSRNGLSTGTQVIPDENGVLFVVEGKAVKGCEIRITAADHQVLPAQTIGKIEIKGDNVTKGYLNLPQLNAEMIKDGWLNTGDLGFLNTKAELIVTGREKDIIFINGQNYYPHDIEIIAEERLDIEKGKIAACGVRRPHDVQDQIILFVLHKGPAADFYPKVSSIKKTVNESAGIDVAEVIPVPKLPKTTSGKIQRYLLGNRYLDGEYNSIIEELSAQARKLVENNETLEVNTIEQTLQSICDELLPDKNIQPDDNIFELGTTSLMLAQLYQRIDEKWPGKLEITDMFDYPTLNQLAAFLRSKG